MQTELFKDIPKEHWAKKACETLGRMGMIGCKLPGKFCGDDSLTRYEGAMLMYRILELLKMVPDTK